MYLFLNNKRLLKFGKGELGKAVEALCPAGLTQEQLFLLGARLASSIPLTGEKFGEHRVVFVNDFIVETMSEADFEKILVQAEAMTVAMKARHDVH